MVSFKKGANSRPITGLALLLVKNSKEENQIFPILSDLAFRVLNAPSSSSIIERTFGKISRYVTKQRNSLKAKTLAAFVKFDEFEEFETSCAFLFKKHGLAYEPLAWTAPDVDSASPEYDYLDGLIEPE